MTCNILSIRPSDIAETLHELNPIISSVVLLEIIFAVLQICLYLEMSIFKIHCRKY